MVFRGVRSHKKFYMVVQKNLRVRSIPFILHRERDKSLTDTTQKGARWQAWFHGASKDQAPRRKFSKKRGSLIHTSQEQDSTTPPRWILVGQEEPNGSCLEQKWNGRVGTSASKCSGWLVTDYKGHTMAKYLGKLLLISVNTSNYEATRISASWQRKRRLGQHFYEALQWTFKSDQCPTNQEKRTRSSDSS